jgi:nucleotide-binding universal stress UspA family protein
MKATYRIVVGVDGSEGGTRALRWAVREASARAAALQAVTAWTQEGAEAPAPMAASPHDERRQAEKVLASALHWARSAHPEVSVAAEAVEGRPADVLAAAARDADLLVLGSHGHSRLRHVVLGSVTEECVRSATCPVVVIPVPRDEPAHPGEVALV